jgi:hypothetical protein
VKEKKALKHYLGPTLKSAIQKIVLMIPKAKTPKLFYFIWLDATHLKRCHCKDNFDIPNIETPKYFFFLASKLLV